MENTTKTENTLISKFTEIKTTLKKRGGQVSKEDFFNDVAEFLNEDCYSKILEKRTPKEFFINEALENDPDFKEKVFSMIKPS